MDSCGSSPFRENGSGRRHGFCWNELPSGRIELADAALFVVRLLLFLIPEREHLVDVGGPLGCLCSTRYGLRVSSVAFIVIIGTCFQ